MGLAVYSYPAAASRLYGQLSSFSQFAYQSLYKALQDPNVKNAGQSVLLTTALSSLIKNVARRNWLKDGELPSAGLLCWLMGKVQGGYVASVLSVNDTFVSAMETIASVISTVTGGYLLYCHKIKI